MFIRKYVDSTRYSKSLQEFMMPKMLLLLLLLLLYRSNLDKVSLLVNIRCYFTGLHWVFFTEHNYSNRIPSLSKCYI